MAVADTDVNIFEDTENSGNGGGGGGGTEVTLFSSRNTITTEEVSPGEWDVNVAGEESIYILVKTFDELMAAVQYVGERFEANDKTSCIISILKNIDMTQPTQAQAAQYQVNGKQIIDLENHTYKFDMYLRHTRVICEGSMRILQLTYPIFNGNYALYMDTWSIQAEILRLNNINVGGGTSSWESITGHQSGTIRKKCPIQFSQYLIKSSGNCAFYFDDCNFPVCGANQTDNSYNPFIQEGSGDNRPELYATTIQINNCYFFHGSDPGSSAYYEHTNAPIVINGLYHNTYQKQLMLYGLRKDVNATAAETGLPNIQIRSDQSQASYPWQVATDGTCLVSHQYGESSLILKSRVAVNDLFIQGQPTLQPEGATPTYNWVSLVDFLTAGFKRGVVSQTQNWTGSSSTGYTYTMTDLVYGNIPIAFIVQWNTICKCSSKDGNGSFNEATGYFEANGLVDISYEEAILIVSLYSGKSTAGGTDASISIYGNGIYARTNLDLMDGNRTWTAGHQEFMPYYVLIKSKIETIYVIDTYISNGKLTIIQSERLRHVYGIFTIIYNSAGSVNIDASSLENINIKSLYKDAKVKSPNLYFNSLVYMIQNCYKAQNPSASDTFTLTVHSNTYNEAVSDTNTYTWEGNTYTGIMNLATAVGCTIVS